VEAHWCHGYVPVPPLVVARTGEDDVRLVMHRAGDVRLRLVAPDGDVIGGGVFTLFRPSPAGYVQAGTWSVSVGGSSISSTLETSHAGQREGEVHRVRGSVAGRGYGRYAPFEVDVVAGDAEPTEVRLERGRALLGRVARIDSSPVAGATVRIRLPRSATVDAIAHWSADHGQPSALSGVDGRFELRGIPQGVTWVTCEATGLAQRGGPRRVDPADREVEIVLAPALELAGRLVGEPPLDFRVEWSPADLAGDAATIADDPAFAGADGFFVLRGLADGAIRLQAWRPWDENDDRYALADDVRAGTSGVQLRVVQGARIEGALRDPAGKPLIQATVLLDAPWGTRRAMTDPEGRFLLHALPPGRYTLRAITDERVPVDAPGPPVTLVR
jgi:hypothetical protein